MADCKRCRKAFDSMDNSYLNGVHWSCLTYDEKSQIEKRSRCKHRKTYKVKICKDCGKRVS